MASVESVAGGGTDERTTEFAAATLPHQSKDQSQRGIDLPHLSVGQVTRDLPESLRIHGGCLFDKHSSPSAQQFHLGAKACGQRRRRGRCHQPGGQRQKMRLHDDRKACPRLLMSFTSVVTQPEHFTTHAASPCRGGLARPRRDPARSRQAQPTRNGAFPGRGDSARAATASRDSAATRSGPGTAAGTDREHIDHNPQHGAVRCPSRTRSTTVLAVTRSSDRSGICHSPGPYPGWLQLPVTDNRPSGPRSRNCASRSGTSGARRRPLGSVTWVGGLVR